MKAIEQSREVFRGNAASAVGNFNAERSIANGGDQLNRPAGRCIRERIFNKISQRPLNQEPIKIGG